MNKILLSAALMCAGALGMNAQQLAFQYQGQNVENGATIIFEGYELDEWGYYVIDPEIDFVSDVDDYVNLTAESNVEVQLCAGGDCVLGTNIVKNNIFMESEVPVPLQLEYVDGSGNEQVVFPEIVVNLKLWYADDPDNVVTLTVKMGGFAGVDSLESNGNSVSVNGNTLSYDVSKASSLSLYSLSGKTVMQKNVGGTGTINLSNLPSGVYVYKINGSTSKAGKFVIK